jgi:hypothetical protein
LRRDRQSWRDPAAAEIAIATILSAIQQEKDAAKVTRFFNQLRGVANLARQHPVVVGSGPGLGGALSSLAGNVVGADAGIIVVAMAQIEAINLSVQQIKNIGSALLSYIKNKANYEFAEEILSAMPSLSNHLGH